MTATRDQSPDLKKKQKMLRELGAAMVSLFMCPTALARPPYTIAVDVAGDHFPCGNPVVLKVTVTCGEPLMNRAGGGVRQVLRIEDTTLHIECTSDTDRSAVAYRMPPIRLRRRDRKGLKYAANVLVWYEMRDDESKWDVVFRPPGTYEVTIKATRNEVSNKISLVAETSESGEKCLRLLADHTDFLFLELGGDTAPQTLARLEDLAREAEHTVLGKMAAARLGIELTGRLEEKYPSSEMFLERYRRGEVDEPLVDEAHSHLTVAYNLPDDFPVRETVLSKLASTELLRGRYSTALSLLDELGEKYATGEYGRRAADWKAEFISLTERESLATRDEHQSRDADRSRLPLPAIVTVAVAAAGVLAIGFVYMSRRSRTKQNTE